MNNENCEPRIRFTAQRGRQGFALILPLLHVFLAHPHLGGGWRVERDGRGNPSFSCHPHLGGVGGERSETEGGISAMVNDGGCPFMFDGTLSFDRVLMPASQASTAWSTPFHCAHPAEDVQVSQSWRLACPLRRPPFIWLTVYAVPLPPRWEANLR